MPGTAGVRHHVNPPHSSESALEREIGWLRSLAASLVQDPSTADDMVQDVVLRRLETGDRRAGIDLAGGWRYLSQRLYRQATRVRRARGRRQHREGAYAGERELYASSAESLVCQAETSEWLLRHLMTLSEGHRALLVLFYFEGRTSSDIATALGVSDDAVRARLRRAREALRLQLDAQSDGQRDSWMPALGALAGVTQIPRSASTALPVVGGLALKVSIPLLAAAAALVFMIGRAHPGSPRTTSLAGAVEGADARDGPVDTGLALAESPPQARVPLGPRASIAASGTAGEGEFAPDQRMTLTGRVLDGSQGGDPVPLEGALVRVHSSETMGSLGKAPAGASRSARTDHLGRYQIVVSAFSPGAVEATCPGYALGYAHLSANWVGDFPLPAAHLREEADDIVLGPSRTVRGRAVNPEGQPIQGVAIRAVRPNGLSSQEYGLDPFPTFGPPLCRTDANGWFVADALPVRAAWLVLTDDQHETCFLEVEVGGDPPTVIMAGAALIRGRVLASDADRAGPMFVAGWPIGGSYSPEQGPHRFARVGEDGTFQLGGLSRGYSYEIQAFRGTFPGTESEPVTLRATVPAGTHDAELMVRRGTALRFTTTGPGGEAVQGLEVEVRLGNDLQDPLGTVTVEDWLFRTPIGSNDWPNGQVRLERIVPRHADDQVYLVLRGDGYRAVVHAVGPFDDGQDIELGTLSFAEEGSDVVQRPEREVHARALDANGVVRPGTPIEIAVHDRAAARGSEAPDVSSLQGHQATRRRDMRIADATGLARFDGMEVATFVFRCGLPTGVHLPRYMDPAGDSAFGMGVRWTWLDIEEGSPMVLEIDVPLPRLAPVVGRVAAAVPSTEGASLALVDPAAPGYPSWIGARLQRETDRGDFRTGIALDPEGRFEFEGVPVGEWLALVSLPGGARPLEQRITVAGPSVSVLIEPQPRTVRGRVCSIFGEPVPGAQIEFWRGDLPVELGDFDVTWKLRRHRIGSLSSPHSKRPTAATTGIDGTFQLELPASPGWGLMIEHDDFATRLVLPGEADTGAQVDCGTVKLAQVCRVEVDLMGRLDIEEVTLQASGSGRNGVDLRPWIVTHCVLDGPPIFERAPAGCPVTATARLEDGTTLSLGETTFEPGGHHRVTVPAN